MANRHTITDLYQMQSLSLDDKVQMTKRRIDDWVNQFGEDGVYVSFSGGKDIGISRLYLWMFRHNIQN